MSLISAAIQLHDGDPAVAIRNRVKDNIDQIRIGGRDVLVGVYEPSAAAKTTGGIFLTDDTRKEWRWQGVTGIILKMGPKAYCTDQGEDWFVDDQGNAHPPAIGDWVMFDVKDTHPFLLVGQPCRLVADVYIRGIVGRPDLVA